MKSVAAFATALVLALALGAPASANEQSEPNIVSGAAHSCALADNGSVKCWGDNTAGQLGDGTTVAAPAPKPITGVVTAKNNAQPPVPELKKIRALAASVDSTCAVSDAGEVWCWGANTYGQLGNGTTDPDPHPTPQVIAGSKDFYAITGGANHFCATTWQGSLSCWGMNAHGQLGNGTVGGSSGTPAVVPGIKKFKSIAAGADFTCAVLWTTKVTCWGADNLGQLGRGAAGDSSPTPVEVAGSKDSYSIVAGSDHTCALSWTEEPLRCWGDNAVGQLAQGTLGETTPRGLTAAAGIHDVKVLGGSSASGCAVSRLLAAATSKPLTKEKYLTCWGDNSQGQLGTGDNTSSGSPRRVALTDVAKLTTGPVTTRQCAIVRGGDAYCWGMGVNAPVKLGGVDLITGPQYPDWAWLDPASRVRTNAAGTAWRVATRLTVAPSPFSFPSAACKGRVVATAFYYKRVRRSKKASAATGVTYRKVGVRTTSKLRRAGEYCKARFVHTIPLRRFGDKRKRMLLTANGLGNKSMAPFGTNEFPLKDVNKKFKRK